jgi:putative GTP pyrophosphokinase
MAALSARYERRYPILRALAGNLEANVKELLDGVQHIDRIYFRPKQPRKFLEKSKKEKDGKLVYKNPLTEIEDQVAGRVLVFFLDDIDVILEKLRENFNPFEELRKQPKSHDAFGYESYHCVFNIPPTLKPNTWGTIKEPPVSFEMQVRTLFMHAWAEPEHDLGYKGKKNAPPEALRHFAWAAASAWGGDRAFQHGMKLIKGDKK